MARRRLIALNGSAGAVVAITATQASRKVYIREDEAAAAQGLTYQTPDDAFTATYTVGVPGGPDQQQISLPMAPSGTMIPGPLLGLPAQSGFYNRPADTYIKLRSKSATATNVRVLEED